MLCEAATVVPGVCRLAGSRRDLAGPGRRINEADGGGRDRAPLCVAGAVLQSAVRKQYHLREAVTCCGSLGAIT